jgi:hypothetical protein
VHLHEVDITRKEAKVDAFAKSPKNLFSRHSGALFSPRLTGEGRNPALSAGYVAPWTQSFAGVTTFCETVNNITLKRKKALSGYLFGFAVFFLSLFLSSASSLAATNNWINPGGGLWNNSDNWSTGAVPRSTDDVFITLTGTYTVALTGVANVASLTVGGGTGAQTLLFHF